MALLSVIIPSYNEELNIHRTAGVLTELLSATKLDYELIFINDGSSDQTFALIEQESQANRRIRGISFSRNFGKEAAIFAGLEVSRGDCCVLIDCDLQFPPSCIPKMVALWEQGYEVVEGKKINRGKESVMHKMSAGLFYKIISGFTKLDMEASSDFKLLDRKVVNVLLSLPERNTFFRALSFWVGFRSTVIEFEVEERELGESKWSIKSLIKYATTNITSYTTAPLHFVTVLGIILLGISLIVGIQTLIRFLTGNAVEGFTTVILLLLLIGGALMVSLGIMGTYIARIYEEVKGRPRYIISKTTDEKKN